MKHFIIAVSLVFSFVASVNLIAQPGIYTEADIEYQTLFIEAQLAKMKGDTDTQVDKLKEVLKRDRSSHAAYYELAQAYIKKENTEMATKNIKEAIKYDPNSEWYQLFLANIYDQSYQTKDAIQAYKQLLAINPDNPTIYHKLAVNQLSLKQADAAAMTLETLISRQGVEEETSRRLFDIYAKSGNEQKAINTLQKLIESDPENTRYLNNLASYYIEIKQPDEADIIFTKVIELEPNNTNAVLALAKKKVSKNEAGTYLSSLTPIIENMNIPLENKIQELMPHLSTMSKGSDIATELNKISSQLVSLYPDRAEVYSLQGDVLFYNGAFEKSAKSYKKALELDDRKYILWHQYMSNLWELESYTQLKNVSEEAIDLYPNEISAFLFHALGLSIKNPTEAKEYTSESKFIAGKNKILLTQIEIVENWITQNNPNEAAISAYDTKKLNDPIYFELLGDIYHRIKNNKMANIHWRQAITLGANESRINKKLIIE